jgi:uncharacterized protein YfiM (DUF2279 family)
MRCGLATFAGFVFPMLVSAQATNGDSGVVSGERNRAIFQMHDRSSMRSDALRGPTESISAAKSVSAAPFPMPSAPRADPWFGPDKIQHFFTSALIQSLGYGTLRALDVEHRGALAGASAVTAGFGIGKELRDRGRGHGFSVRDLVWDAAGAVTVSLLLARTER